MSKYQKGFNSLKNDLEKGFSKGHRALGLGCALSLFELQAFMTYQNICYDVCAEFYFECKEINE